jgi:hypothetical protein
MPVKRWLRGERYSYWLGIISFGAVLTCLLLVLGGSRPAAAIQTAPYKLNYQGQLTNAAGVNMPDGLYNMKFRLFSVLSGGAAIWTEVRDTTNRVSVANGQFAVQLGDVTALTPSLFTSQPLYLEVELPTPASATCSTSACGVYTEGAMTPRQALASSAYAMNADTLDGYDSSSFLVASGNNTLTGTNLFKNSADSTAALQIQTAGASSLFIADTTDSRIQIGSSTADATAVLLVLDTKNTAGDPAGVAGAMYYNSSLSKFRCYEAGAWVNCTGPTTIVTSLSDATNNNIVANTLQTTNLTFPVAMGVTYHFRAVISYTAAATTTGSRWTLHGPGGSNVSYVSRNTLTATTETVNYAGAVDLPAAANLSSAAGAANIATVEGIITSALSSGTADIQFASKVSSSAIVAKAGSTLTWW